MRANRGLRKIGNAIAQNVLQIVQNASFSSRQLVFGEAGTTSKEDLKEDFLS